MTRLLVPHFWHAGVYHPQWGFPWPWGYPQMLFVYKGNIPSRNGWLRGTPMLWKAPYHNLSLYFNYVPRWDPHVCFRKNVQITTSASFFDVTILLDKYLPFLDLQVLNQQQTGGQSGLKKSPIQRSEDWNSLEKCWQFLNFSPSRTG